MHCLTGLVHDRASRVSYDPHVNQEGIRHRSLKLAALQKTLRTPPVFGDTEGELLVVGWGSTKGAIEEAVDRVRTEGRKVGALHMRFLQPMPSGVGEILRRFDKVITVENSWSDSLDTEGIDQDNRRYANLAWLLRARYLVDVDCWSEITGLPTKPGTIATVIREKLHQGGNDDG
jgi:2-oxoglutarate ferredoxin oxidoreductase subunit alpha